MHLDVRLPIGLLFSMMGGALSIFGLMGDNRIYQRSLGININLRWGIVMLAFGLLMLWLGRRGERRSVKS